MNLLSKSLWRRGVHGFAAICLVTLCVAFAPTLQNAAGQSADASLSGSVTDDGGAPIYRARVMVLTADLADTLATLFTDEQGIYSDLVATNVAIEESPVETADDLSIASLYPNPTGGEALIVTVAYTGPSAEQKTPMVELFDVLGRRTSPQSRLASGLYFVRLRLDADRVSDSHALVVSSPGEVAFRLQRSDPGTEFSSAIAAKLGTLSPHGKNGTTGTLGFEQVAALIRVEKAGYVTEETTVDLLPQSTTVENFSLDGAPVPSASFTVAGTLEAGGAVTFDASASVGASGETLAYSWDFGDGLMGGGEQVAHSYPQGGTVEVTLTVAGNFGATATTTQEIAINNPPPPVSEDGTLHGAISDISGFSLPDVTVSIVGSDAGGMTDPFGNIIIDGVGVGVPLTVRLHKPGYAAQVVQVGIPGDTTSTLYFEAAMRPRDAAVEVTDAENGFRHRGRSGVMVDIPVDGLVRADGSPATGNIQMALTPVDVSDAEEVRSFPGRFEGLLPDGEDALLLSLGTAEYAFEQEGEPLQLAPGKTAEVEIPIYTDGAIVGDQIPLWSMNETTGAWVHEGLGTVRESTSSPSGLVLAGRVSHFSWWNCDHFDEDPDDAEGLCYKWECFNGLCNKVKVFCWVEGAIHGDLDKRAALSPPVFSARKFFPQEGGNVILPGGRTVTLRGTSLQGNVLLRSDTTFVAVPGGSSSFELTLDTAVVYDVNKFTLPVDTMATMETSTDVHIYEMDAVAGQVFGYSARRVSGGSFSGTMIVRSEDGTEIATNSMNNQIRLVRIPEDGTYSFVATAASASNSTYRFIVQPVYGSVPVNSNTEVAIPDGQFRLFQFEVQQEQTLNLGVYADGGLIRSDLIAYNTALQSIATHAIAPDTEPFEVVPGTHYIVVRPRQNLTDPVRFGLSVVTPDSPTLLTFNSAGMADISTALNYHGQYRYYEFDATEGDGFELGVFRPDGVGVENMHFRLVAPDVGQLPSIIPHQGWDDRIVTGWSMQLPRTGRYRLLLSDNRFASTGAYELRLHKVAPSQSIVVDDDMECAGAVTASPAAALHALEDGGTVTVCDGLYESPSRLNLSGTNVTLEGESRDGVILRFIDRNRSPGATIDVSGRGTTLRNLTLESGPRGGGISTVIQAFNTLEGNVAVFEDLIVRPIADDQAIGYAIRGEFEDVAIRRIVHTNIPNTFPLGLEVQASENIVLESSSIEGSVTLRRTGTENLPIMVDNLTLGRGVLNVSNAATGHVRNSTIDGSISVTISDSFLIQGNQFSNSTGSSSLKSINANSTTNLVVEQNTTEYPVQFTVGEGEIVTFRQNRLLVGDRGEMLVLAHTFNQTGGTFLAESNVIETAPIAGGNLRFQYTEEFGEISFANNTFFLDPSANYVETVPYVLMQTRNSSFTGSLPVTFVNNIFVGDGSTVFQGPAGTSIDADYNLYHNFTHILSTDLTNRTGGNDLTGDPLLTGTDLQVQSGSPAIDSGAAPAAYPRVPGVDYGGAARPAGAGYDRGAWEQ